MHLLLRLLFFPVNLPPFVNSIPGVYKITIRGISIPIKKTPQSLEKISKIDTLDALEEHEEHEDDYQTDSN